MKISLQWKEFNINLDALGAQLKVSYPSFGGFYADAQLDVYFSEDLSQQDQDAIQALWDSITNDQHELAQSYISQADLDADKEVKKASAKTKLLGLGLTEAEVKAILGV